MFPCEVVTKSQLLPTTVGEPISTPPTALVYTSAGSQVLTKDDFDKMNKNRLSEHKQGETYYVTHSGEIFTESDFDDIVNTEITNPDQYSPSKTLCNIVHRFIDAIDERYKKNVHIRIPNVH